MVRRGVVGGRGRGWGAGFGGEGGLGVGREGVGGRLSSRNSVMLSTAAGSEVVGVVEGTEVDWWGWGVADGAAEVGPSLRMGPLMVAVWGMPGSGGGDGGLAVSLWSAKVE